MTGGSKRERTAGRIASCALELFERQGFEATTVAQVAAAAGVTEMTVFRHFPAKESMVLDDPYDPLIAAAVGAQPVGLAPLARAVAGLRQAWGALPEPDGDVTRRRVRVVVRSDALRAAAVRTNAETERLIVEQLVADGAGELQARVAAGATLAALMAALSTWAERDDERLGDIVEAALDALDGRGAGG